MNHKSKRSWLEYQGRLTTIPRRVADPFGDQIAIFSSRCGNYGHRGIGETREIAIDKVYQDIKSKLERILFG